MLSCRTLAGFASTKKNARHTKKKSPRISKSTTRHLLKIDAAPARLFMNQWACWSYNMKFLVSCSHRGASKTPFAFIDFLPAPCICVSCSCWGEIGSLFIVFIHFISTAVLTEGPFGFSPTHTQTIYYGQAGVSERGQGTGALVHDFVDTMNSRSEKAISYDTSPPKTAAFRISHTLKWTPLWQSANRSSQKEVLNWIECKIRKFAYAINDKKIYSCVRFNRNSCLTAKADNAALYLRGDKKH